MKEKFAYILIIVLVIVTFGQACNKGPENSQAVITPPTPTPSSCSSVPAKFSTEVNPIIQSSCAIGSGCHGNGSHNGPGPLLSFDQIKNAASSIKSAVVSKLMPLGGSLTMEQIQSISCWADNGALNN